jgi:hypothetical protein
MILSPSLVVIRGRDISLGAESLLWREEPGASLTASLAAVGQLTPVIVDMADKPVCLAGYKRVRALVALGLPVRALVLEPDFMTRLAENPDTAGLSRATALGLLYLASNHGASPTDAKLLLAGRYFARHGGVADFIRLGAPELGLPARDKVWDWLQTWLGLPEYFDALVRGGHIPLAVVKAAAALGHEGLEAYVPYLRLARWSRGNAEKLLGLAREAALARDISAQRPDRRPDRRATGLSLSGTLGPGRALRRRRQDRHQGLQAETDAFPGFRAGQRDRLGHGQKPGGNPGGGQRIGRAGR